MCGACVRLTEQCADIAAARTSPSQPASQGCAGLTDRGRAALKHSAQTLWELPPRPLNARLGHPRPPPRYEVRALAWNFNQKSQREDFFNRKWTGFFTSLKRGD